MAIVFKKGEISMKKIKYEKPEIVEIGDMSDFVLGADCNGSGGIPNASKCDSGGGSPSGANCNSSGTTPQT